ncbi:hypothetical protein M8J77_023881 [Diaphorina citri]|nr:hypothetical protein M8J77_023881 [Diaphorina citri]
MGRKVAEKPRITVSGIRLPDPIPHGEVLTDTKNGQWKIGRSIGFGGFGEIYLASEYKHNYYGRHEVTDTNSKYVIKVEPHSSSTLFVEMNFYLRVATEDKVNEWKEHYKQTVLGMPHLVSFGSHFFHEKLRFLVLPRYGCDVQKKFYEFGRRFHPKTAFTLCYYIIDILEYIHSHGYVHNDMKASNLVLGCPEQGQAPVYLVDFGLACRYIDKDTGLHKPYCEDERRAHNGTLEYTSRDGHCGAMSRKGDLEVLGYNLLQWLVGYLPWEMDLSDPERVATLKKRAMAHINDFVSRCYIKDSPPGALIDYLKYINSLDFDTTPDYKYCKKLFRLGVQQSGYRFDKVLSFDSHGLPLTKVKSIKRLQSEIENIVEESSPRKLFIVNNSIKTPELRIPCNVQDFNRITRHSATESQILSNQKFDWIKVLQSNPEKKFAEFKKKERLMSEKACDNLASCDELINSLKMNKPTYAMLEQMERMRQRQLAEQNHNEECSESDEVNNNSHRRRRGAKSGTRRKSKLTRISETTSPKKTRSKTQRKLVPASPSPSTGNRVASGRNSNRTRNSDNTTNGNRSTKDKTNGTRSTNRDRTSSPDKGYEMAPRSVVVMRKRQHAEQQNSTEHTAVETKKTRSTAKQDAKVVNQDAREKRVIQRACTREVPSNETQDLTPVRPGRPKRFKVHSPGKNSFKAKNSPGSKASPASKTLNALNRKLIRVLNRMAISGEFKLSELKQLESAPRVHRSELKRNVKRVK